ncbi:MAG: adenine nucleotide alpha hydrolase [Bacteroidales bacterium]|nr:adenine nucleotide alpha hydrolase [Bacteroidales bacterium]
MAIPIVLSWSGGKDSSLALYYLKKQNEIFHIAYLLTTVTEQYNRISMHGVRNELLEQQAQSLQIPLITVKIPPNCTNEEYEQRMLNVLAELKKEGISHYAFGDIFLKDVRQYRENQLNKLNLEAIFPLWGFDSNKLANEFIELGFKAILTCVDTQQIEASFAGNDYNLNLLKKLPAKADPCGENGEFHSFVYDGPIFSFPIRFQKNIFSLRENRFCYCDLLPA